MIITPLSCTIECLQTAGIMHEAFFSQSGCEVNIHKPEQLTKALFTLEDYGVRPNLVTRKPGETPDDDLFIVNF